MGKVCPRTIFGKQAVFRVVPWESRGIGVMVSWGYGALRSQVLGVMGPLGNRTFGSQRVWVTGLLGHSAIAP